MPHRPLFVLRCHHFSPVIYFIAISVSLPPSPSPPSLQCLSSFTCALSLPPSGPLVPSFSCTLSSTPLRTVPTNTSLETLHYTTQHNSTLLTLLETLLYVSVSVSFSLLPFLSRARSCRSVFSFARVASHRRHFDDDAECEKEGKRRTARGEGEVREIERGRETESNRERVEKERERRWRGDRAIDGATRATKRTI